MWVRDELMSSFKKSSFHFLEKTTRLRTKKGCFSGAFQPLREKSHPAAEVCGRNLWAMWSK